MIMTWFFFSLAWLWFYRLQRWWWRSWPDVWCCWRDDRTETVASFQAVLALHHPSHLPSEWHDVHISHISQFGSKCAVKSNHGRSSTVGRSFGLLSQYARSMAGEPIKQSVSDSTCSLLSIVPSSGWPIQTKMKQDKQVFWTSTQQQYAWHLCFFVFFLTLMHWIH